MIAPEIDLRESKYRLEAIPDHIDYTSATMLPQKSLFLRVYDSMETKHHAEIHGRGNHDNTVLITIRRPSDEYVAYPFGVHGGFAPPVRCHDLAELVSRLIVLHQLSGAGLDADAFSEFLATRRGRAETCPTETL